MKYLDPSGAEFAVDPEYYRTVSGRLLMSSGWKWPALGRFPDAVRIRYRAGYDGNAVAAGGTGHAPERVKQAIIMGVQHLMALSAGNLFLRSETVEGVGSTQYAVSDQAGNLVRAAAKQLLAGLKAPRV